MPAPINFAPRLRARTSIRVSSAPAAPNNAQSALNNEMVFRMTICASFDDAFSYRSIPVRFRDVTVRRYRMNSIALAAMSGIAAATMIFR